MKMLQQENTEEIALRLAMPHIRKICHGKWLNLEPEDRVSEAAYFFVCAFRSIPLGTGNFIPDYEDALVPYMNEHNRDIMAAATRWIIQVIPETTMGHGRYSIFYLNQNLMKQSFMSLLF